MNCQQCQAEIEVNLSRQPSSDGARQHVARCGACREFQRERLALKSLVGGLARVEAPADFEFRLRARLAAEKSERHSAGGWGWPEFVPGTAWLSLAGCLALAFAAALYLQKTNSQTMTLPASERLAVSEAPLPAKVKQAQEIVSANINDQIVSPSVDEPLTKARAIRPRRNEDRAFAARRRVPTQLFVETLDTGSLGAQPQFVSPENARQIIPLQLSSGVRPMQVELRDSQGESRTVTVEPVSFGSRDVVSGRGAVQPTLISSNQGVW